MTNDQQQPLSPAPRRGRFKTALVVAGLLAAGGVVGAGVVHAQMSGRDWDGPRGGWRENGFRGWGDARPERGMGGPRMERFARFCGADTARFQPVVRAYAKADLRLTDAQSKDFDSLADLMLPALEDVKREACANFSKMSDRTPEKLAQLASVLRKAADAADKSVEPARKFYASLDSQQQARVDELSARPGPRWH